jgi:hypothetical protein
MRWQFDPGYTGVSKRIADRGPCSWAGSTPETVLSHEFLSLSLVAPEHQTHPTRCSPPNCLGLGLSSRPTGRGCGPLAFASTMPHLPSAPLLVQPTARPGHANPISEKYPYPPRLSILREMRINSQGSNASSLERARRRTLSELWTHTSP